MAAAVPVISTVAQVVGAAVGINTLLNPPKQPNVTVAGQAPNSLLTPTAAPAMPALPSASDLAIQQAKNDQARLAAGSVASGRAATILTSPGGSDRLG